MYVWCDALSNYITALGYEGTIVLYAQGELEPDGKEGAIKAEIKKAAVCRDAQDREIRRQPGNPMVRGHGTRKPGGKTQNVPEQMGLI